MTSTTDREELKEIRQITFIDSGIVDEQTGEVATVHTLSACGFVVNETDREVVLAREHDDTYHSYRGQLAIPRVAIIKELSLNTSLEKAPPITGEA